jgi:hypothetical protein
MELRELLTLHTKDGSAVPATDGEGGLRKGNDFKCSPTAPTVLASRFLSRGWWAVVLGKAQFIARNQSADKGFYFTL